MKNFLLFLYLFFVYVGNMLVAFRFYNEPSEHGESKHLHFVSKIIYFIGYFIINSFIL